MAAGPPENGSGGKPGMAKTRTTSEGGSPTEGAPQESAAAPLSVEVECPRCERRVFADRGTSGEYFLRQHVEEAAGFLRRHPRTRKRLWEIKRRACQASGRLIKLG